MIFCNTNKSLMISINTCFNFFNYLRFMPRKLPIILFKLFLENVLKCKRLQLLTTYDVEDT